MRQKAIVLAVVAFLVVSVAGAFVYNKSQTVMAGMSDRLALELTRAFGGAVSVGSLEISAFNKVMLYDVVIRDERGGLIASGPKMTVGYDLLALLRGDAAVTAVKELALEAPRIYLERRSDGKWNVDDLLDKTSTDNSPFGGKITIRQGTVTIRVPEGHWQFADITAGFDFAGKPDVALTVAAAYQGGQMELNGHINRQGNGMLAADVTNIDLGGFGALIAANTPVKLTAGRLAQAQILLRRDKGPIALAGEAKIDGVNVDVAGLAVREARGRVAFSDKQIFLFPTTAKIYDQDIEVRGKIGIDTAEPVLGLTVSAAHFDPAAVGLEDWLSGPLSFTAVIGGTPTQPGVSLNAAAFGGQVSGTGTLKFATNEFTVALNGRDLDLAAIPHAGISIAGRGDVDLRVEGAGDWAAAKVAGTIQAKDGQLDAIPFATLSAGFAKADNRLTVDYLTVGFPGSGILTARGTADNGQLGFTFFGQGIPLSVLAGQTGSLDIDGTADAEGTVAGATDDPLVAARFTAYSGRMLMQPFVTASGTLAATRAAVTLEGLELADGATRHTVNGSIGLTGARELNLTVATRHARAENLVKLIMPGERLTGNVDNDMTITGSLTSPSAKGHVKLSEGSFRGQLIARAEGSYRHQNGETELSDFVINSLNTEVSLAGTVSAAKQLNLAIAAKDIDVANLHIDFPYPVAGRSNLTGRLTGTTEAPAFSGEITAVRLDLNGQALTDVEGQLYIDSEELNVPSFGFSQGEGKFTFTGGLGFADGAVYGDLAAQNGSVAGLLAILNIPVKDIDGRLDGQVTLGGTVARPDVRLTGTLTRGKIKNCPLENIEADIALSNNLITINRFFAKQGAGVLAARGTAALGGRLDMEISGRDLDAGLLTAWFNTSVDTRGKLTFTAQVTGTSYSPYAAVSLEIKEGGVENTTFDALYGLFVYDQRSINVNQLMVTKGPYKASAYGTIPLAALNREGLTQATAADQMDLKLRLEQANLSILPLLTKEVAWATGETKGEVTIGGTLAQPHLSGSIAVQDGTIKLKSLAEPIQKVGLAIQFEGDKINIMTFDGSMGGGTYHLTGQATLNGLALADYQALLILDKLGVNHKYFKGPLAGTLTLNAVNGKPVLGGRLIFDNTTVNIPFVPDFAPSGLDLGLDLELVAAKKVRLFNPYFYDLLVEGKAKFTGSTLAPVASGRFTAVRGTVSYLRTQFKVDSGSADFTRFDSFLPVINLTAATKLDYTTINLAVHGPLNTMELRLTSEPAMSQQQILSLLTLRSRYADRQSTAGSSYDSGLGREEVLSLLDAGLQMTFIAEAESAFRNSFGLDEFRLVRSTTTNTSSSSGKTSTNTSTNTSTAIDEQVYNVEIGKYLTDRLFLTYTVGIDHNETSGYFRYDLSRRFSATWGINAKGNRQVGVEARFTF